MNFEHTEDRRMLADTLNRFVSEQYGIETRNRIAYGDSGMDAALWAQFAELGAISALFPEQDGGFGGAGFDVAVVFEALGRGLVVEPFLGALMVGRALGAAGTAAQKEIIAGLMDGSTVAALAHDEPGSHYALSRVETRAVRNGEGWLLTGQK
ncbi:MAG: acyl-CoA dehydrogenase family protein, partial [Giesbergeria sp.]|nr:acyl-CoA dehydrogenase family protein [Giesbergeria sp.]